MGDVREKTGAHNPRQGGQTDTDRRQPNPKKFKTFTEKEENKLEAEPAQKPPLSDTLTMMDGDG
jgi:hypothetical protein